MPGPAVSVVDRFAAVVAEGRQALLATSLGIVFLWFGLLKLAGRSPVAELVAATVPGDPAWTVPLLGGLEVAIGLGLLTGLLPRVTLVLFAAQMAGTFAVLLVHPALAFQDGNPLLLSASGEFVVKNLVLLAAGLVLLSRRIVTDARQRGGGNDAS